MAALVGTIQVRKDTAANWTANNPVLLSGEQGLETDTRRVKIGDGVTLWNALAYSLNPLGASAATDILRRSDGDARYDATGAAAAAQAAAATDATTKANAAQAAAISAAATDATTKANAAQAAAIAAASTDATTKANAAQAAAIASAATDATTKANAAQAAAIAASQPLDSDLTAIAGLTPANDDIIQRKAGAWTNRTLAQLLADFAFTTIGLAIARLTNPGAVTFLRMNADNTATARTASEMRSDLGAGTGNGDALVANPLSQFAATTSAQLKGVLSDEMAGTGTKAAFGESGTEVAYSGTPTWTAGAAPSSTANLRQFYTQVGNCVTWQISLTYATGGTTLTNVSLTFPSEFPAPAIPTGFTGASVKLCPITFRVHTSPTATPTAGTGSSHMIARNAADNGFEISGAAFGTGTYRVFIFSGSYFTS